MLAYRVKDIAKPNGPISRATLFRHIAEGRLEASKVGHARVILAENYRKYLEGGTVEPNRPTT